MGMEQRTTTNQVLLLTKEVKMSNQRSEDTKQMNQIGSEMGVFKFFKEAKIQLERSR